MGSDGHRCRPGWDRLDLLFAHDAQDGLSNGFIRIRFPELLQQIAAERHTGQAFEYPKLGLPVGLGRQDQQHHIHQGFSAALIINGAVERDDDHLGVANGFHRGC